MSIRTASLLAFFLFVPTTVAVPQDRVIPAAQASAVRTLTMIDLHDVLLLDTAVADFPEDIPELTRELQNNLERIRLSRFFQARAENLSDSEKLSYRAQQWQDMLQRWIRPALVPGKDRLELMPNGTLVASLTAEGHVWLDRFLALQLAERRLLGSEIHVLAGPTELLGALIPGGAAEFLTTEERDQILEKARKTANVEVVLAPTLVMFERARTNIAVFDTLEYVKDWSVHTVEPGKRKLAVPVLDSVEDGLSVTMRCVMLEGGQFGVEVNLQRSVVELPLKTSKVHLDIDGGRDVEVALPKVDTQRLKGLLAIDQGACAVLEAPPTADGRRMVVLLRITKAGNAGAK